MTTKIEYEAAAKCIRAGFGYYTFAIESYEQFIRDISPLFVSARRAVEPGGEILRQEFVWRGHADPTWLLQSSLSRFASSELKESGLKWQREVSRMTTNHLINFLLHLRGTGLLTRDHDQLYDLLYANRNNNDISFVCVLDKMTPAQVDLTHELFALGQHHGLFTPFLDWTSIPLTALYFAFEQRDNRKDGVGWRVVFALNKTAVEVLCPPNGPHGSSGIRFLGSMAHDNDRVVAQAGSFTFVPAHMPVDLWVVDQCRKVALAANTPVLIRFLIRNQNRDECLAELASMNIHARTVYPDRFGAALHANYLSAIR